MNQEEEFLKQREQLMKFQDLKPSNVYRFLKKFEVFSADSVIEVVDRLFVLLKNTKGIKYDFSPYKFVVYVETERGILNCVLNIYRNDGEYKKTRDKYSTSTSPLLPDKPEFVVEMDDLTRYFNKLFLYISEQYSAETIAPFSDKDLNYGLYCPDY
jgi:hypothetical protein